MPNFHVPLPEETYIRLRSVADRSKVPATILAREATSPSQGRRGPTIAPIPADTGGLKNASFAVCHQVTTLDRTKITKQIGVVTPDLLERVEEGLKAALDLD